MRIDVPRLTPNDDDGVVRRWLVEDGAMVKAGQPVVVLETSKAAMEVEAPVTGVLRHLAAEGETRAAGEPLGSVGEDDGADRGVTSPHEGQAPSSAGARGLGGLEGGGSAKTALPLLSDDARALADRHGLTMDQLAGLGKRALRRADVQGLLTGGTAREARRQASIARLVERAAAVPAAFMMVRAWCDGLLGDLREWCQREHRYAGVVEVLIKVVAIVAPEHPRFYRRSLDEEVGRDDPVVGVTIDMGSGLFVPVLRNAATEPLADVAAQVMQYRDKALADAFTPPDLEPAHISISLAVEQDVLLAIPLVPPPQTCILSLCGPLEHLALREDGTVQARRCLHLGLTYDHRCINGVQAGAFLATLKRRLEGGLEAALAAPPPIGSQGSAYP